jgi:hypothetical protein
MIDELGDRDMDRLEPTQYSEKWERRTSGLLTPHHMQAEQTTAHEEEMLTPALGGDESSEETNSPPGDLAQVHTGTSSVPSEQFWWSRLRWDGGVTITVFGLVCYAVARFAIDGYLSQFHLTSSDVGLGYADVLAPVAFVAAGLLVLVIALQLIWLLISPRIRGQVQSFAWRCIRVIPKIPELVAGIIVLIVIYFAILAGIYYLGTGAAEWFPDHSQFIDGLKNAAGLVVLFIFIANMIVGPYQFFKEVDEHPSTRRLNLTEQVRLSAQMFSAFLVIGAMCTAAHWFGVTEAHYAKQGQLVEVSFAGILVPGVEAYPTLVTSIGRSTEFASKCFVRLGTADGFVVGYDPERAVTTRISILSVSLSDLPEGQSCPAPPKG